jgi:hypothetical protein
MEESLGNLGEYTTQDSFKIYVTKGREISTGTFKCPVLAHEGNSKTNCKTALEEAPINLT